jgi:hypothetical protein
LSGRYDHLRGEAGLQLALRTAQAENADLKAQLAQKQHELIVRAMPLLSAWIDAVRQAIVLANEGNPGALATVKNLALLLHEVERLDSPIIVPGGAPHD